MPEPASQLYLHGMGHFHPEGELDNRFFEALGIDTNESWILERVGIRSRRTVLPLSYIRETYNEHVKLAYEVALHDNADTGARAARMALSRAGLRAGELGMVVSGGCSSDRSIPADACRIAAALGAECPTFDLNSACSSFGAQLHLLACMHGLPRFVLVVNPENTTRVVNYRDRASAVLWGDGTSAAILSRDVPSRVSLELSALASSPSEWQAVQIPRFGHFEQSGSTVQRFAIKTSVACLEQLLPAARARCKASGGRLRFIGHQANLLMLEAVAQRAGITTDEHWHNVEHFGNTGAAGAPSVLSQRWSELAGGDTVLMVVVGAGLTWASLRFDVED